MTGSQHQDLWRRQWGAIRSWLGSDEVIDHGERPSVLDGWVVRDLVAHLGRSLHAATLLEPSSEQPLTLIQYVAGYADGAEEIADDARRRSARTAGAIPTWIDDVAADAFSALEAITSPVVRGPRGPITTSDFVTTRLLELVVHADDLARSLPSPARAPLLDEAVEVVARALSDGYHEVTGHRPRSATGIEWIRAATGRVPSDDDFLPLL